jgi:hypothetical protein
VNASCSCLVSPDASVRLVRVLSIDPPRRVGVHSRASRRDRESVRITGATAYCGRWDTDVHDALHVGLLRDVGLKGACSRTEGRRSTMDCLSFRRALNALLEDEPNVEVIGTAADGVAAVEAIRSTRPTSSFSTCRCRACRGSTSYSGSAPHRCPRPCSLPRTTSMPSAPSTRRGRLPREAVQGQALRRGSSPRATLHRVRGAGAAPRAAPCPAPRERNRHDRDTASPARRTLAISGAHRGTDARQDARRTGVAARLRHSGRVLCRAARRYAPLCHSRVDAAIWRSASIPSGSCASTGRPSCSSIGSTHCCGARGANIRFS